MSAEMLPSKSNKSKSKSRAEKARTKAEREAADTRVIDIWYDPQTEAPIRDLFGSHNADADTVEAAVKAFFRGALRGPLGKLTMANTLHELQALEKAVSYTRNRSARRFVGLEDIQTDVKAAIKEVKAAKKGSSTYSSFQTGRPRVDVADQCTYRAMVTFKILKGRYPHNEKDLIFIEFVERVFAVFEIQHVSADSSATRAWKKLQKQLRRQT